MEHTPLSLGLPFHPSTPILPWYLLIQCCLGIQSDSWNSTRDVAGFDNWLLTPPDSARIKTRQKRPTSREWNQRTVLEIQRNLPESAYSTRTWSSTENLWWVPWSLVWSWGRCQVNADHKQTNARCYFHLLILKLINNCCKRQNKTAGCVRQRSGEGIMWELYLGPK